MIPVRGPSKWIIDLSIEFTDIANGIGYETKRNPPLLTNVPVGHPILKVPLYDPFFEIHRERRRHWIRLQCYLSLIWSLSRLFGWSHGVTWRVEKKFGVHKIMQIAVHWRRLFYDDKCLRCQPYQTYTLQMKNDKPRRFLRKIKQTQPRHPNHQTGVGPYPGTSSILWIALQSLNGVGLVCCARNFLPQARGLCVHCGFEILADDTARRQHSIWRCGEPYQDYINIFHWITHERLRKMNEINSTVTQIWLQRHLWQILVRQDT